MEHEQAVHELKQAVKWCIERVTLGYPLEKAVRAYLSVMEIGRRYD